MKVVLASKNKHKLVEISKITEKFGIELVLQSELGIDIDPTVQVAKLSTAQQQVVEIVKVLSYNCRIIIMDEPTSALDFGNQLRILQLVKELAGEGYGVLLSTHKRFGLAMTKECS